MNSLTMAKKRKLGWSGLAKIILKGRRTEKNKKKKSGKTILKNGQGWTVLGQLEQLKSEQSEE